MQIPIWIDLLVLASWNPSDVTREGISHLDAADKVMAEEGSVGDYSGEIFTEICKN
jgi:hypothetical protein